MPSTDRYYIHSACAENKSEYGSEVERAEVLLAAYSTSPGELEGVPTAEGVRLLSAFVIRLCVAAILR